MNKCILDPVQAVRSNVYDEHRAVWALFGDRPDRERDFLYRSLGDHTFLVVSDRMPQDASGMWTVQTKDYDPALLPGMRVLFSLRVNPVRKTWEDGKQKRHDIVQDLRKKKLAEGATKDTMKPRPELAQQAARDWLAPRQKALGLNVEVDTLLVESYQRHSFRSSSGRNVRFATLDLKGFATVEDPEALRRALFTGVGPSKGFGCGLLLVRKV